MAKQENNVNPEVQLETSEKLKLRKMAKSNADKIRQGDSEKVRLALISDDVKEPGIPKSGDKTGEQASSQEEERAQIEKEKELLSDILEAIVEGHNIVGSILNAFDNAKLGIDMQHFLNINRREITEKIYDQMKKHLSGWYHTSNPAYALSSALELYYFAAAFHFVGVYEDELRDAWIQGFCLALRKGEVQNLKDMITKGSAIVVVPRIQWTTAVYKAFDEGLKAKEGTSDYQALVDWGKENGMYSDRGMYFRKI